MAKKKKPAGQGSGLKPSEIRTLLEEKLRDEGRDDLAEVLAKCATPLVMSCTCCAASFTIEKGCKKRWCPVCAPRVSATRLMKLEGLVSRFQWPLSVTLTMRNVEEGEACVQRLKDAFRKFRRTDFWADRVRGGVAGFEVTHRGRGFHPHLHALVDCRWLAISTPEPKRGMTKRMIKNLCERAQNELAEVWGAYVQGEKAVVWANRAYGKALTETLKYAIKPSDLLDVACEASQIIDEIDRGRMVTTFGVAHACNKDFVGRDEPEEHLSQCEKCGGFKTVLPADVIDMYHRRPDLAHARFHELMSIAGDYSDRSKPWDPKRTIPRTVPKGRKPSRHRTQQAAK